MRQSRAHVFGLRPRAILNLPERRARLQEKQGGSQADKHWELCKQSDFVPSGSQAALPRVWRGGNPTKTSTHQGRFGMTKSRGICSSLEQEDLSSSLI